MLLSGVRDITETILKVGCRNRHRDSHTITVYTLDRAAAYSQQEQLPRSSATGASASVSVHTGMQATPLITGTCHSFEIIGR